VLEGRRVVHAVSGHGDDLAVLVQVVSPAAASA
jgi:hypothetical protein